MHPGPTFGACRIRGARWFCRYKKKKYLRIRQAYTFTFNKHTHSHSTSIHIHIRQAYTFTFDKGFVQWLSAAAGRRGLNL